MVSDDLAFEALRKLVAARAGLDFLNDREDALRFALGRVIEREGAGGVTPFYLRLTEDGSLLEEFIEELTVGETYFFREPAQFRFLRDEVLPEIRSRHGRHHPVRAWSAACSTGEEVYSLAMLFDEEGLSDQAGVLGTDLSEKALAKARLGSYGDWSLRDQGETLSRNHLTPTGRRHLVSERVRRRVRFERLNLAGADYPSPASGLWRMDLILCRNVLIYFDRETIRHVARRLHDTLAPGGWLLTASTDPPIGTAAPFLTVVTEQGIFYRREAAGESIPESAEPSPTTRANAPTAAANRFAAGFRRDDPVASRAVPKRAASLGRPAHSAIEMKVRSLAEVDAGQALRLWLEAVEQTPLSGELYHLGGMILLSLDRLDEAIQAVRRSLYLDPSAAASHFLLGTILSRRKDKEGAARAFRNARDLAASRPPGEPVAYAVGEAAGRLATVSQAQLTRLERG